METAPNNWPTVGVAGARGLVGSVFLSILGQSGLPADKLILFSSRLDVADGEGEQVAYRQKHLPVLRLNESRARQLDVLFLATGADASRQIMAGPGAAASLVIDNSSAFRQQEGIPLVVPEANLAVLADYAGNLIANPNCTTAGVVVVLAPIAAAFGLQSVDLASYQAVSGAGRDGMAAFEIERERLGRLPAGESPFVGRIAENVVPQIDVLDDDGWTGEETKIHAELRKILGLPELDVAATAVRVPVQIGHSVALHWRTKRAATLDEIERVLRTVPGLRYLPADGSDGHPMPLDVEGTDPVLVGRLRAVAGRKNGFACFVVSDNLRKGAALNAIQVAVAARREKLGRLLPSSTAFHEGWRDVFDPRFTPKQ